MVIFEDTNYIVAGMFNSPTTMKNCIAVIAWTNVFGRLRWHRQRLWRRNQNKNIKSSRWQGWLIYRIQQFKKHSFANQKYRSKIKGWQVSLARMVSKLITKQCLVLFALPHEAAHVVILIALQFPLVMGCWLLNALVFICFDHILSHAIFTALQVWLVMDELLRYA